MIKIMTINNNNINGNDNVTIYYMPLPIACSCVQRRKYIFIHCLEFICSSSPPPVCLDFANIFSLPGGTSKLHTGLVAK
jgi:hypothetical protein